MSNICKLSNRELATIVNALTFWNAAGRPQYPEFFAEVPDGPVAAEEIDEFIDHIQSDVTFEAMVLIEEGVATKVFTQFDSEYMQIHVFDTDQQEGDLVSMPLPEGERLGLVYTPDKVVAPQTIDSIDPLIQSFEQAVVSSSDETISEDDFEERYLPRQADSGDLFEFDELKRMGIEDRFVWTIVEGDSGDLYASAGYHLVNRLGYIITEVPWTTGLEEAVWHRFESDDGEDEEDSSVPSFTPAQASDLFTNANL